MVGDGFDGFRRTSQRRMERLQKEVVPDQEGQADRERDQDMANIAAVHWSGKSVAP